MKNIVLLFLASSISNCIRVDLVHQSQFVAQSDDIESAQDSTIYPFFIDPETESLSTLKTPTKYENIAESLMGPVSFSSNGTSNAGNSSSGNQEMNVTGTAIDMNSVLNETNDPEASTTMTSNSSESNTPNTTAVTSNSSSPSNQSSSPSNSSTSSNSTSTSNASRSINATRSNVSNSTIPSANITTPAANTSTSGANSSSIGNTSTPTDNSSSSGNSTSNQNSTLQPNSSETSENTTRITNNTESSTDPSAPSSQQEEYANDTRVGFKDASGDTRSVPPIQNLKPPKDTVNEEGQVVPVPQSPPAIKEPCPDGTSLLGEYCASSLLADVKQPQEPYYLASGSPNTLVHEHSLDFWGHH